MDLEGRGLRRLLAEASFNAASAIPRCGIVEAAFIPAVLGRPPHPEALYPSGGEGGPALWDNGANLGFEQKLWAAADKVRGHMDAAVYMHVVLGLIFLKYTSGAFKERYDALKVEEHADPEDRDEYTAENVFWAFKAARCT